MKFPHAFLITWTTYGTWLHGDDHGSFDRFGNYLPPDPARRAAAAAALVDEPVYLSPEQRADIDALLVGVCTRLGWVLHARNVRTNHVHVVVSAAAEGKQVRSRLKGLASLRLSEHAGLPPATDKDGARKWWTEKGNIEEIWDGRHLEAAIRYVNEQQSAGGCGNPQRAGQPSRSPKRDRGRRRARRATCHNPSERRPPPSLTLRAPAQGGTRWRTSPALPTPRRTSSASRPTTTPASRSSGPRSSRAGASPGT